jgi:SAM-dependent methyltransferase
MKSTDTNVKIDYPVEIWFSEVETLEYSDYWNDEGAEREKIWWVADGDFVRMESYLSQIDAVSQLEACLEAARTRFSRRIHGVGVDLAAGNLWATSHLIRLGAQRVISVEYSRHRLMTLGPIVLDHYGVAPSQALLALGDFHRLNLEDGSIDFVFMSQAFHHSEHPGALLREIRRILMPEGFVMITGEHMLDPSIFSRVLQPIKYLVSRALPTSWQIRLIGRILQKTPLWLGQGDFVEKDDILGDHYFLDSQYRRLFSRSGFDHVVLRRPEWQTQAFLLIPKI